MTEKEAEALMLPWADLSNAIETLLQTPVGEIAPALDRLRTTFAAMHPAMRKATRTAFHPQQDIPVEKTIEVLLLRETNPQSGFQIAEATGLASGSLSAALKTMEQSGRIVSEGEGPWIRRIYRLKTS